MEEGFRMYIGDEEVDVNPHEGFSLEFSVGSGVSEVSAQDMEAGDISVSFSIYDEDNPVGQWYNAVRRRTKCLKKVLMWALTHGYVVVVGPVDEDGDRWLRVMTPRMLRRVFSIVPFVPGYRIFTKDSIPCVIRKGRVVEIDRLWPCAEKMVNEIEKRYEEE